MKTYNKNNIPLARTLRKNMTPWERKLWYQFLRTHPLRFQRQKTISDYIVDFYCAQAKLIIELDGSGHYEPLQVQKDSARADILRAMGFSLLRFTNYDVDNHFEGVCMTIDEFLSQQLSKK